MRILSTCLLSALLPLAAIAAPDTSQPDASGAPPASTLIQLRTADGLPIAVEFVSYHRGEVKVRHPATQRELSLTFTKLDATTQKLLEEHADVIRKKIDPKNTLSFSAALVTNSRATPASFSPLPGLLGLGEKESDNVPRTLEPGGHSLRIRAELPKDVPVDVPVELKILWATSDGSKNRSSSSASSGGRTAGKTAPSSSSPSSSTDMKVESAALSVTKGQGEFYTVPTSKMPSADKRWAVIAYNKATGQVFWKQGNTAIHQEYLAKNPPPPAK
jgi:hypothetical protein